LFDCSKHDILLSKLNFYIITGRTHEWFKSCLRNRYQRVEINKECSYKTSSDWGVIELGVSKGSVLGCLLFPLHVNDL
jgi:hypothetical protein